MEEVSSRRSSNDEYGSLSSSLMEPAAMHDVMSLEMRHSMADNYLDPRSFGDGGSFDEFGGTSQMESRFEADNGYEQPVQQRSHYASHQQGQPLPPPGSRFDHHTTHPPVRTAVPTYPVKTVDPNTSSQFAPARMIKPPRIRHSGSRSSQKKEPMDPKTVEDEVARNVSQILSATKQQKLAQEAQQRCGIVTPVSRINFSCSDCGKTMTSHRNLQTYCCRKVGEWVDRSQSWPDQWNEKDPMSEDSDSLPGIGAHSLPHSSFSSESSGWCSPNNSYSPSAMGSIDMGNMLPLSLDTDDSHTHSSSASHCSNSSTGKGGSESFMCDACKKTVCSLRSLKRHHTTCKQYITEFGPPQDGVDTSSLVPIKQRSSARRVKTPNYTEDSTSSSSGGNSPARQDYECLRLLLPRRVPADSTQNDDDRPQKQILAANTCADCNRQLCSASNLKRHRATCKMALTKGEAPQPPPAPPPPPNFTSSLPELPAKDRNIIDRSYAAAVAASEHVRMQARAAQQGSETPPPPMVPPPRPQQQYTAYIVTSPRTNQKPQPYVTVGEHLRAKHVQQKLSEPIDEPQGAVLIQNTPLPNAPAHNQIVQIRRPSQVEKSMPPPTHPMRLDHSRPTHVTVIKSDSTEIPPLESIITTQPLSGDRVTGVPVLVQDSRQQGLASKAPTTQTAEFQCPECKKTYSCRKNVKRHRMAVHKITSEDISRWPGPAPCPHAHIGETSQLSPSLPRILLPPRVDPKAEFKTETIALSSTVMDKGFSQDAQNWQHDFEDPNKEIGVKRHSSEMGELDEKKSRPELAEADSTFNEDKEFGSNSHHSSPGIVSSSGPLPSLASWMSSRLEIPYGGTRSAGHSPLFKSRRFDVDVPSSFFSHDDGLPLDPMLGHGPSSAPRDLDEDAWYKQEEMPDSTTCQRLDRSTSPGILMESDPPPLGTLPYTRKRALSGGSSSSPAFSTDPKQIRHQCQDCGKFYSSEWNLERHRRESCPTKIMPPEEPAPVLQGDEISILIGSCRFVLPRSALTKASTAFTSLFQIHDPAKGELRLEGDPMDFQNLLDVYNDPVNLTRANVDSVLALAEQYKFVQVTDTCAKFICDELSKLSLMHAIRLADQHKLLAVKIRLFSSISIEVFRALNSDRDYQMMSSELKAELLEKWGTFL